MDFVFASTNKVLGDTTTIFGETVTTVDMSFVEEVLEVFDMGYYVVTGKTPQEEGWIPRILLGDEYEAVVDACCGGDPGIKRALGFCCIESPGTGGLELIIRGNESLPSVLLTLAHESGHARQHALNPFQNASPIDTNVGAIREAEAFALEVAVSRALGEMAGLNVSRFPDRPEIRAFIDSWVVGIQENVEDFSEPHDRGLLFLWLAVLKDAQLEPVRQDLLNNHILSPDSLFGVHNRLVSLPPQIMDSYVEGLLDGVGDNQNIIIGELTRRLDSSVPTEGFIKYDLTPVLVP